MISKDGKNWLVDIQPSGRGGKRFRKTFHTKAEAIQWEAWLRNQVNQQPAWAPAKRDLRKMSELVDLWFKHHGNTLNSGADTKNRLLAIATALGDPVADNISSDRFSDYRTQRLESGISEANMNREHAYMRAMFNTLEDIGKWKLPNPVAKLKQFKINEPELTYLKDRQIQDLLREASAKKRNPHTLLITKLCLCTGARWGEAEGLTISQLQGSMVQYARTKSTKTRAVPISDAVATELREHYEKHGDGDRFFAYAEGAFREAVERAGIVLPDGQMTHILRHTFASHFMQNGGNIITLQKLLGHASLAMTMRYAHMAPDHMSEAKRLNPLAKMYP